MSNERKILTFQRRSFLLNESDTEPEEKRENAIETKNFKENPIDRCMDERKTFN